MPVIPALRRLKQEYCDFEADLGIYKTLNKMTNKTLTPKLTTVQEMKHYLSLT